MSQNNQPPPSTSAYPITGTSTIAASLSADRVAGGAGEILVGPAWFLSWHREPYLATESKDGRFDLYKKKPYLPIYTRFRTHMSRTIAARMMEQLSAQTNLERIYTLDDLRAAQALDALAKE